MDDNRSDAWRQDRESEGGRYSPSDDPNTLLIQLMASAIRQHWSARTTRLRRAIGSVRVRPLEALAAHALPSSRT